MNHCTLCEVVVLLVRCLVGILYISWWIAQDRVRKKKKKEKRRKRNDLHMFVKFAPLIIMQFESLFPYSPSFFFFPIFPFFFLFLFFFFSFSHTPYSMINEQVQSIASHHAKPMTMELSI